MHKLMLHLPCLGQDLGSGESALSELVLEKPMLANAEAGPLCRGTRFLGSLADEKPEYTEVFLRVFRAPGSA